MSGDLSAANIKGVDMAEEMKEDAIKTAQEAFRQFTVERDRAKFIKKEFDRKYQGTWHCIVGKDYGSFISHESKHFINFYLDEYAVLLFKAG